MSQSDGVTIGLREIYDSVQNVAEGVRTLNERVGKLEDLRDDVDKMDERILKAHDTANAALDLAKRNDDSLKWLWRTVGGAVIVTIVGAIFVFHK